MADISKETVQQFQVREQRAWQRRAVVILAELLEQGERGDLPVLTWEIGHSGAHIIGRAVVHPTSARRERIEAWGQALGIELREHPGAGTTTITGVAKQRRTKHGLATIVLTCDIYTDDEHEQAGPSGTRAGTA